MRVSTWVLNIGAAGPCPSPDDLDETAAALRPSFSPPEVFASRACRVAAASASPYSLLMEHQAPAEAPAACPRCGQVAGSCICDTIAPIDNRIELVILQHPREQSRPLGTARLAALHFRKATLKIGLSWPSLGRVLGGDADPHRFAILYLGSARVAQLAPGRDVVVLNRKGEPERDQDAILRDIEGVVLLDGNWSEAKALWWRNPWMLKCRRVILRAPRASRYGSLRRAPRRDELSTIEAAAMLVSRLEGRPEIETALIASFERLLARNARGSSQSLS
jgi:DTW domain-containing protein YfiP